MLGNGRAVERPVQSWQWQRRVEILSERQADRLRGLLDRASLILCYSADDARLVASILGLRAICSFA